MSNVSIGIIWIDEPVFSGSKFNYVNYGYECISSDPDKIRKVKLSSLDRQRLYITNIKPHKYSALGLSRFDNIRSSKFLGITLSTIAIDLGISDKLTEKLPIFYTICQMLANKLQQNYNVDLLENCYSVVKLLNQALLPEHQKQNVRLNSQRSIELEHAISNSMQKVQGNNSRRAHGVHEVSSARFSRAPYALELLNMTYPASNDYYQSDELLSVEVGTNDTDVLPKTSEVVNRLVTLSKDHCGFVEFEQIGKWDKYHSHYPLGKEISQSPMRRWAALPEIIDLLNYSQLRIGVMYLTRGERLDIAPEVPEVGDVSFLSYVNGLINEIVWTALGFSNVKDRYPSPVSTYIRAYDRIMCRLKATEFIDEQFQLSGFTTGTIRFYVNTDDKKEIERLRQTILDKNMLPQLSMLK